MGHFEVRYVNFYQRASPRSTYHAWESNHLAHDPHTVKTFIRVHFFRRSQGPVFFNIDPTEMVRQARVPVGYTDILWYTMIYFFVEVPYQTSIAWILTLIVYLLHFPSLIVYISGVLPLSHFYRYVCLHLHDWYVYVMCSVYIYAQENDQHIQKLTR